MLNTEALVQRVEGEIEQFLSKTTEEKLKILQEGNKAYEQLLPYMSNRVYYMEHGFETVQDWSLSALPLVEHSLQLVKDACNTDILGALSIFGINQVQSPAFTEDFTIPFVTEKLNLLSSNNLYTDDSTTVLILSAEKSNSISNVLNLEIGSNVLAIRQGLYRTNKLDNVVCNLKIDSPLISPIDLYVINKLVDIGDIEFTCNTEQFYKCSYNSAYNLGEHPLTNVFEANNIDIDRLKKNGENISMALSFRYADTVTVSKNSFVGMEPSQYTQGSAIDYRKKKLIVEHLPIKGLSLSNYMLGELVIDLDKAEVATDEVPVFKECHILNQLVLNSDIEVPLCGGCTIERLVIAPGCKKIANAFNNCVFRDIEGTENIQEYGSAAFTLCDFTDGCITDKLDFENYQTFKVDSFMGSNALLSMGARVQLKRLQQKEGA